jgi:hypothetical protein
MFNVFYFVVAVPQHRRLLSRELAGVAVRLVHRALTGGDAWQQAAPIIARVNSLLLGHTKAVLPLFRRCDLSSSDLDGCLLPPPLMTRTTRHARHAPDSTTFVLFFSFF